MPNILYSDFLFWIGHIMKKIIFIIPILLFAVIVYAYDPSIETTGTEKEKKSQTLAEQKIINRATNDFASMVKRKKKNNELIEVTKEDYIENAVRNFRKNCQKMKNLIKNESTNINFYGRVVDQSTNPIANVLIPFSLYHYNIYTARKVTFFRLYTDENGCFEIIDARGLSLSFDKPIKDGYEFAKDCKAATGYKYNRKYTPQYRHHPDPNNPVLFFMKKIPKKALIFSFGTSKKCHSFNNFFNDKCYSHIYTNSFSIPNRTTAKWFNEKGYFQGKKLKPQYRSTETIDNALLNKPQHIQSDFAFEFAIYPTPDTNVIKIVFYLSPDVSLTLPTETKKIDNPIKEAPKTGYQLSEISLLFTNGFKHIGKTMFFKVSATTNKILYGRLSVTINESDKNSPRLYRSIRRAPFYISIGYNMDLNVEGTRNLLVDRERTNYEMRCIQKGEVEAREDMERGKKRKNEEKNRVLKYYKLYK